MNILSKTLTKTSKSNIFLPSIPIHLHPFSASSPYSTKLSNNESQTQALSPKKSKNLERPSEILFQPKVANWLSLIGTVKIPVESCTAIDGKSWAGTIISQEGRSGSTYKNIPWISVIFEGDLAITAATHLKENDTVYVAGHLSPDYLPINLTNDQVKVQVMAHDLHFVRKVPDMEKDVRTS
ncbi:protein OSB3, chloroplastic/mitochondrial-like [Amaranthus tricolor]|uniref:protein OSB3, chloroplastic/mitochondrial-like n=1 Tax=Amaranthus tricolor TaxID=29722 RepID=UPI00258C080B|nr:protein OSB3, chloroplastic/mitochondrial-like [Amaranthus tricolor]